MNESVIPKASITVLGVAIFETRVVTGIPTACMTLISSHAPNRVSGCATRSNEGLSSVSSNDLGFRDSMSAESVGVYEGVYRSIKYSPSLSSDGIGPIAWRGKEQKADVGHHQTRDFSGTSNWRSLSMTGFPTSSYRSARTEARVRP